MMPRRTDLRRRVPVMGSEQQWQNNYNEAKNMVKGSEEDKEKVIRNRILKFFKEYQTDLFHVQRRDAEPKTAHSIFPNGLLLYGIDFLS